MILNLRRNHDLVIKATVCLFLFMLAFGTTVQSVSGTAEYRLFSSHDPDKSAKTRGMSFGARNANEEGMKVEREITVKTRSTFFPSF